MSVICGTVVVAAIIWLLWRFLCRRSRPKDEVPPLTKSGKQRGTVDAFGIGDKSNVKIDDLQILKFEKLVEATDGFSESNLLGAGGFGQVYKVWSSSHSN